MACCVWGQSFATSNVHDQLAQQQISFPTKTEINAVKAQYAKGGQKAVTDPEFPNAAADGAGARALRRASRS